MITDIRRVMTGPASTRNGGKVQVVIEPGDSNNVDGLGIEERLSTSNTGAPLRTRFLLPVTVRRVFPRREKIEDSWCERNAMGISAQGIVNADEEIRHGPLRDCDWPPKCSVSMQ